MAAPLNEVIATQTEMYLAGLDPKSPPTPRTIERELLARTNDQLEIENLAHHRKNQIPYLQKLTNFQLAQIMLRLHTVRRIAPAGFAGDRDLDLVAMYALDGPDEGIYLEAESVMRDMVRKYNNSIDTRAFKEIVTILGDQAERVERCTVPHYSPVKNGIFDAEKRELLPFSPDLVWLAKSDTAYNENAASPVIHNPDDGTDWEYEEWLSEVMGGDKELVQLMHEVNSALMFPNRRFNKFLAPFATTGNNGKGTLNELWRALVGRKAVSGLDIAGFDAAFPDESLVRAHAVIADENPVGSYLDKVSNFKAACTGDVIPMNRKFKRATAIRFRGFIIQPLNGKLRLKDKSDSFWRRTLMVPFAHSFTGRERAYIKLDYVNRPEVLEYVLKEALHANVTRLSNPAACQALLAEQKTYADPVRAFWEEHEGQFVWDMLPYAFLYDMFVSWSAKFNPTGKPVSRLTFIDDLVQLVEASPAWRATEKEKQTRPAGRMDGPEPLIAEYGLTKWMNPMGLGSNDVNKVCLPTLSTNYRGALLRVSAGSHLGLVSDEDEDAEESVVP